MTDSGSNVRSPIGQPRGQAIPGVLERCLLPLVHPVMDEGVVHVVSDGPDRSQVQGAIAVDLSVDGGGAIAMDRNLGVATDGTR